MVSFPQVSPPEIIISSSSNSSIVIIKKLCPFTMGSVYPSRYSDTRPERPWGPPNLLYNGYRVDVRVDHPHPSSVQFKETVPLLPLWATVA